VHSMHWMSMASMGANKKTHKYVNSTNKMHVVLTWSNRATRHAWRGTAETGARMCMRMWVWMWMWERMDWMGSVRVVSEVVHAGGPTRDLVVVVEMVGAVAGGHAEHLSGRGPNMVARGGVDGEGGHEGGSSPRTGRDRMQRGVEEGYD